MNSHGSKHRHASLSLTERNRTWAHSKVVETKCNDFVPEFNRLRKLAVLCAMQGVIRDSADCMHVCVAGNSIEKALWERVAKDIVWDDVDKALQMRHPALFEKLQQTAVAVQVILQQAENLHSNVVYRTTKTSLILLLKLQ